MKLVYSEMFPPFQLECDKVNLIAIESGSLYYKMVSEFAEQCGGHDGGFVLSEGNELMNISRYADIMTSFIPFEVNTKRLLTKLYAKLELLCEGELYEKTLRVRYDVAEYLTNASGLVDSDIEFESQIDLKALFRCFELKFSSNGSLADNVISYMLNSSELDGKKLFVTAGLLNFLSSGEAELFMQTATDHKLTLLMFENREPSCGGLINRMTIDEDYCIF